MNKSTIILAVGLVLFTAGAARAQFYIIATNNTFSDTNFTESVKRQMQLRQAAGVTGTHEAQRATQRQREIDAQPNSSAPQLSQQSPEDQEKANAKLKRVYERVEQNNRNNTPEMLRAQQAARQAEEARQKVDDAKSKIFTYPSDKRFHQNDSDYTLEKLQEKQRKAERDSWDADTAAATARRAANSQH